MIRRAAALCVVLLLAVVSLSAFIRLSSAGLGCADWPRCYGKNLRAAQAGSPLPATPAVAAARVAHRVLGGAVLLVVLFIAMASLLTRPVLAREGGLALAMLAIAFLLALLGFVAGGARVPAVTIANLVGGFLTLALAWRLATPASPRLTPRLRAWAVAGAALVLAQVALGGLVSASYAALSCPSLVDCMPDDPSWSTLDPWREPVLAPSTPVNPAGALAQALHRLAGVLVVAVLVPLGVLALRRGARRTGVLLIALPVLQAALGAALVLQGLPLPLALLHNLIAALAFAAVLRAA